ncbi:DUF1961 family protein [Natronospora cellulosivora (SeqCode)]
MSFTSKELIYENNLASKEDVKAFKMEGEGAISFPKGRMRMETLMDPEEGQKSNIVYWCPEELPENILVEWDFWPIHEPGLCIIFFAAQGKNGEDIFDPSLSKRTGEYNLYHHGDINTYHLSYFRRRWEHEKEFHTCNLRKSYGHQMVAQGADPIPSVIDAKSPYHISLLKNKAYIEFSINDLTVLKWNDDGDEYGPILGGGKIGFRQMSPLIAEYSNLKIYEVK